MDAMDKVFEDELLVVDPTHVPPEVGHPLYTVIPDQV
jgi:hypothetical protein